jgi:hypothetical protein
MTKLSKVYSYFQRLVKCTCDTHVLKNPYRQLDATYKEIILEKLNYIVMNYFHFIHLFVRTSYYSNQTIENIQNLSSIMHIKKTCAMHSKCN